MEIHYNKNNIHGQHLTPLQTYNKPTVHYKANPNKYYTLIIHDPNAVKGNRIHWLTINIPGSFIKKGETIFDYDGPHPPKNSGLH